MQKDFLIYKVKQLPSLRVKRSNPPAVCFGGLFRRLWLLAMTTIILQLALPVHASERSYDHFRDLLLQANVDEIIARVDKTRGKAKDLSYSAMYLYFIALLVTGDLERTDQDLQLVDKKHRTKAEFQEIEKHLKFFTQDYNFENIALTDSELATINLIKLLPSYIENFHKLKKQINKTDAMFLLYVELNQELLSRRTEILENIDKIIEPVVYCPTKIDFLMELKDDEANNLASKLALDLIEQKREKLFPSGLDLYELASAYKALAVLSIYANKPDQAKRYIELAKENIYKIRSIWVVEDIIIKRPILKIDKRVTKFGYLIPQWLVLLREEYDAFFIS